MTAKQPPVPGIEDLIAAATLRETTVPLCLAGHLVAEYEDLERQLSDAATLVGQSLAGSPRVPIAERIEELRAEMAQHLVNFRFRALGGTGWSDLLAAHPDPGRAFKLATFVPAAISACAIGPEMTPEQYLRLEARLSHGQREALFDAVWTLNTVAQAAVPFSLLASATASGRTGES
jgi:hypothetical protein